MTLQGSTNDFPLEVLLRLLADTKKTGELTIRGANGDGALGLSEGQVVTAVFAQEKPIPALGANDVQMVDGEAGTAHGLHAGAVAQYLVVPPGDPGAL